MTLIPVPAAGVVYNDSTNKLQRGGADLSSSPAVGDLPTVTIAKGGTGQTTAALARTALGLAIGVDVQAQNVRLADVAGLGVTANSLVAGNGSNLVLATLTALLDAVFGSTRGMILTRGAATWGALAIGSANKLLKTDGTDPSWATLTTLLDAVFSSTQGAILYRAASAWAALNPGTVGQLLATGGASANPYWTDADAPPGTPTSSAASLANVMVVQQRGGTAPGLFRLSGGATLGSLLDATTFGTNEAGTITNLQYVRTNDWVEFNGKEYCISTTSTTSHKVYERPIGGPVNTTAVRTETATVNSARRTGLHVVTTGNTKYLVFCYPTGTTNVQVVTYDGTTWTSTANAVSSQTFSAVGGYGACVARGCLWVPSLTNIANTVWKVTPATGGVTEITGGTANRVPVLATLYGRVFALNSGEHSIYEITGGSFASIATLGNGGSATSVTISGVPCLFPYGDSLVAVYTTTSGGSTATCFWKAAQVAFASTSDVAPSVTQKNTLVPTGWDTPAGAAQATKGIYVFADNLTDPANPQYYLWWATAINTSPAVGQLVDLTTSLGAGTSTGLNTQNYSWPSSCEGGGGRFSADDTANAIRNTFTAVKDAGHAGQMTVTVKIDSQDANDTWTWKVWYSINEDLRCVQGTLTGSVTGSGTRSGNQVDGVADNTQSACNWIVGPAGDNLGNGSKVKALIKFYRTAVA